MALNSIPTRENEFLFRNISSNASLYAVDVNVPVETGDYLGFGLLVQSTMHFFDVGNSSQGTYYYRRLLKSSFDLEGTVSSRPYLPLITAMISRKASNYLLVIIAICKFLFVSKHVFFGNYTK